MVKAKKKEKRNWRARVRDSDSWAVGIIAFELGMVAGLSMFLTIDSAATSGDRWVVTIETENHTCGLGEPVPFMITVEGIDDFDYVAVTMLIHYQSTLDNRLLNLKSPLPGITLPRDNFEECTIEWYSNDSDDPTYVSTHLQWDGWLTFALDDPLSGAVLWEIRATPVEEMPDMAPLHYSTATEYVAVDMGAK